MHPEVSLFYTCVGPDRIFSHFGPLFALSPPNSLENQNFEKMKNVSGGFIILYMCTINENHMMYGSWDMECNRQNFFSFWVIFAFLPH